MMKNRWFALMLAIMLLMAGCAYAEGSAETLAFSDLADWEFYFASGAGGWRTVMRIDEDGRFEGVYSDSEMGSVGEGYPKGSYYYCRFEGTFAEPVQVNEYTYSMKIEEISCANEPDTTEIIDEVLYCYSTPFGIDGAEELTIYLPGAPTAELPEAYMNWVRSAIMEPDAAALPFYGLYNAAEQNGFSSYDVRAALTEYMTAVREQADAMTSSLTNDPLNQAEMNELAQQQHELWDAALNYVWNETTMFLPEEELEKRTAEQAAWMAEMEKAVEEAGKEVEGGSMYPLVVHMEAAKITEERVCALYEQLVGTEAQ